MSKFIRSLFVFMIFCLALAGLVVSPALAQAQQYSPNGFPVGQCTWGADGRANAGGWRLWFKNVGQANAAQWPGNVQNAVIRTGPLPWANTSIMVFPAQPGFTAAGHVTFVEQVWGTAPGNQLIVISQANWATGQPVRWIQGIPIYQDTYQFLGPGQVRRLSTGQTYQVTFLTRW